MKTKKSVVTKMLDFVRKAAVRNAGLPSTRGMHEPEVPEKIGGGWKARRQVTRADALDVASLITVTVATAIMIFVK